jgi:hypothetical protein
MNRISPTLGLSGGLLAVLLWAVGPGPRTGPATPSGRTAATDSADAAIALERVGDRLRLRALFRGGPDLPDSLSYELSVRRSGAAGTTQTTQSGVFSVTPGRPDTLSTVEVNVRTGDHLRVRVHVRAGTRPVDTAHLERTFS